MPGVFSIPISEAVTVVTAATATGTITVSDPNNVIMGCFGWLVRDDGTARVRVRLIRQVNGNTFTARAYPDNENANVPSYGLTNFSTYNGASKLYVEAQLVSVVEDSQPRPAN